MWAPVGEADRAERAATPTGRAEDIARSIPDVDSASSALVTLVEAAAEAGDVHRAEATADAITAPYWRARALASAAGIVAEAGDVAGAATLIARAHDAADSVDGVELQAWSLCSVAEAAGKAGAGDVERARALVVHAETVSRTPDLMAQRELITGLRSVAEAAVEAGDREGARKLVARAEAVARSLSGTDDRDDALASAAEVAAVAGDLNRVDAIVKSIADPYVQAWALMRTGQATARAGRFGRARTLLGRAAIKARQAERDDFQRARSLGSSIGSAAKAVELGRAEAAARSGKLRRAARIADSVRCAPEEQAKVLVAMSDFVVRDGAVDRVDRLVARAETISDSIRIGRFRADPFERERAVRTLALLAEGTAKAGDPDRAGSYTARADSLVESMTGAHQARALVSMAEAAIATGHHERGRALVTRAETVADSLDNPYTRASVLVSVAEAAVRAGDFDRAHAIAESIDPATTPEQQAQAFLTLTASRDPSRRARAIARALQVSNWHVSVRALVEVAPEALAVVIAELDAITEPDVP